MRVARVPTKQLKGGHQCRKESGCHEIKSSLSNPLGDSYLRHCDLSDQSSRAYKTPRSGETIKILLLLARSSVRKEKDFRRMVTCPRIATSLNGGRRLHLYPEEKVEVSELIFA